MLIAAWVVEAAERLRLSARRIPAIREILLREIAAARGGGTGAAHAASTCGAAPAPTSAARNRRCSRASRASAGCRATARPTPPQVGLFGRPTLINNVETLFWVRDIVEKGPDWFAGQGRNGRKGLRTLLGLGPGQGAGRQAGAGRHHGARADRRVSAAAWPRATFKAYLPGGASGGILPASMADIPLDFGTLEPHGCFIGSAAVVVLSDQDDMKAVALNLMRFFEDESCGQCTPCRVGTEKAVTLMKRAAVGRGAA